MPAVQFLPIIERELRVAAHQPRTWWRRILTMGAALALFAFLLLAMGQGGGLSMVGRRMFAVLGVFGTVYALLAGPFATADCLSRERREGTLGLLFLTDLRSYDVVLGKMAAASLHLVLDLVAALPVVAMPVLMGGDVLLSVAAQQPLVARHDVGVLALSVVRVVGPGTNPAGFPIHQIGSALSLPVLSDFHDGVLSGRLDAFDPVVVLVEHGMPAHAGLGLSVRSLPQHRELVARPSGLGSGAALA